MSILSDFFVAAPAELTEADLLEGVERFPCVMYKNIDTIKLATLEELATGLAYDAAMSAIEGATRTPPGEELPMICAVSPALTSRLAALTDATAEALALKWIRTEEWEAEGATDDDLSSYADMLMDIGKLAAAAVKGGKTLYLRIDL